MEKVVSRTLDSVQNLISRLNLWLDIPKSPQQNFLTFSGQLLASIIFLMLEGIFVIIILWKSMKIAHCVKITKIAFLHFFSLFYYFLVYLGLIFWSLELFFIIMRLFCFSHYCGHRRKFPTQNWLIGNWPLALQFLAYKNWIR